MSPNTVDLRQTARNEPSELPAISAGTDNVCYGSSPNTIRNRSKEEILNGLSAAERSDLAQRHSTKVSRTPVGPRGCWEWTGALTRGYGQITIRVEGRQVHLYAHRVAYLLEHGTIDSRVVRHDCDNPKCQRPSHLLLGTQADNLNDARERGRLIDGRGARVLTDDAYREILAKPYARGSGIALAQKYGVSEVSISRIRNGHQGSVFRDQERAAKRAAKAAKPDPVAAVLERVACVHLPVKGILHVGNRSAQRNSIAGGIA